LGGADTRGAIEPANSPARRPNAHAPKRAIQHSVTTEDAPQDVFIEDNDFARLSASTERYYLVAEAPQVPRLTKLAGNRLFAVKESGGKCLFTTF
jgi:hypothetical protein